MVDINVDIEILLGVTIKSITKTSFGDGATEILFVTRDCQSFTMYHCQDCREAVKIDSISGNLKDLIGSPIVKAECAHNSKEDSFTGTFYKLTTDKGTVVIKWYGQCLNHPEEPVFMECESSYVTE